MSILGIGELWNPSTWWQSIAVWFAVAIAVIGHDLILFPLYALTDRLLSRPGHPAAANDDASQHRVHLVPVTNYLRMPILAAGLLLLMFLPGIIEQTGPAYTAATGLTQTPYLTRWLLLTAAFYLTSALGYAAMTLVRHRHHPSASAATDHSRCAKAAAETDT